MGLHRINTANLTDSPIFAPTNRGYHTQLTSTQMMVAETFPFNKLPVEMQLLVWQYAIADLAQVLGGDLDLSTSILHLRGQNIDHAKDYLRLLSTCHLSRNEVLRSPPVFMVEDIGFPYLRDADIDDEYLAIKSWHFPGMFTDILLNVCHIPGGLSNEGLGPGPDVVGEILPSLFGPKIRRVHIFAGDHWDDDPTPPPENRLSWAMAPAAFRSARCPPLPDSPAGQHVCVGAARDYQTPHQWRDVAE